MFFSTICILWMVTYTKCKRVKDLSFNKASLFFSMHRFSMTYLLLVPVLVDLIMMFLNSIFSVFRCCRYHPVFFRLLSMPQYPSTTTSFGPDVFEFCFDHTVGVEMYRVPLMCLVLLSRLPAYRNCETPSQQVIKNPDRSSSATGLSKALRWYASPSASIE